jgi:DNA-binding response OmpR family regulator
LATGSGQLPKGFKVENLAPQSDLPLALIVEDEDLLAELFVVAFEEAGYKAAIARDGRQALEWLAESTPHIVMLDIHLPFVSGDAVFREMQKDERFANTKVIMATADVRKAKELEGQADMVLVKPVGFRDLNRLIDDLRPDMGH